MSSNPETNPEKAPRKGSESDDASQTQVENHTTRDNTFDGCLSHMDSTLDPEERKRLQASAKLDNPLAGLSPANLARRGEEFCAQHGFTEQEDIRAFRLGAMIAGNMNRFDTIDGLNEQEKAVLDREITHKWSNPTMLYAVIV
jgi:hypothetical protein